MKKISTRCFVFLALTFSNLAGAQAQKNDLKNFLLACAYGTAGGAALGLLTVAISDDPDSKMNRVAQGASLGLYAGIGFGLYLMYEEPTTSRIDDYGLVKEKTLSPQDLSPVWMSLQTDKGAVTGAKLDWVITAF